MSKIVAVYCRNTSFPNPWFVMSDDGKLGYLTADELRNRLTASRQTLHIPDDVKPGWLGIPEDIPAPSKLSELWINVYPSRAYGHFSRELADAGSSWWEHRVAIIHLWTDDDGIDHAEIERCGGEGR